MRRWRVVPRVDSLGNQLWSLQYDVVWSDGSCYGSWKEDRVFRDETRAMEDLAVVQADNLELAERFANQDKTLQGAIDEVANEL